MTNSECMKDYVAIINDGDKKFKYGLVWEYVYAFPKGSYEYRRYPNWAANHTEQEIHDKLLADVTYAISKEKDDYVKYDYMCLYHIIDMMKSERIEIPIDKDADIVDKISDYMYWLLTDGAAVDRFKSFALRNVCDLVWMAANMIIRDYAVYYGGYPGITNGINLKDLIKHYFQTQGIEPLFKCDW